MTDSGGPQRRTLCFLSTLLSQRIPEKSDAMLRCIISGQPEPEVTWYKNGRAIDKCGTASSYEFFENQYIHVLHLSCCTPDDAAIYQISARNCFGMICCSASIEVQCSSQNLQCSPNPKDEGDVGWNHEMETYEPENTSQIDDKECPYKEEESIASGPPVSADSLSSQFSRSCSLQLLASNDLDASSSEKPLDVKDIRQAEEAYDPNNREEIADGLLFPNSSNVPSQQGGFCHRIVHSKGSKFMEGAFECSGPDEEDLNSSHHSPKVQKYISLSLPLTEAASSTSPGDRSTVIKRLSPPASSTDSDSDYELCPEITLTYTEEFSDDDLEYLECSDVMTDYSNAVWQRNLQGTGHVFLLESDDEEMEFHECGLGGCERFLSEVGCGPLVSDDTGPVDATTGLRGHHSAPREAGVRSSLASTRCASSQRTGMTLTLGPHRDGTSMVTDQGTSKAPAASEAAENGYPGIPGETRDSQAGEGFASDSLLPMDKAVTGRDGERLSGELGKSGMDQCWESAAEQRAAGKDSLTRRSTEKPARARRPGVKGGARKLNPNLDERATEASLNCLRPKGPVKRPCTPSERRASSHARAEATDLNSAAAGGCAVPAQAEQGAETLQAPPGSLPNEGSLDFWGEGVWVKNVYETSLVPDRSDQPQVQIQETVREQTSLCRMPAFSESAPPGATTNSFPNLGETHKENASLTQYLEVESCARDPQQEENHAGAEHAPGRAWGDLGPALSTPEASSENMPPCALSAHLPQENSPAPRGPQVPSVSCPELVHTVPTLEALCDGPRDREAAWGVESLEAGDQGTCDAVGSPPGAPVGKYLPQEIRSMDFELAGQCKVSDSWSPDDKTLDVLLQTGGSEPPWSVHENSKERNSAMPPLFISTFTWNMTPKASKDASGDSLAKAENSASALASMAKAGRERLSPSNLGWLEERQRPSSENGSAVWSKDGRDEGARASAQETADTWASRSSIAFSQEKPAMLTANRECSEETRENGDTSALTTATKVHPHKYFPVSMAGNSQAGGLEESLPQVPGENISQFPADIQLGCTLNNSTTESSKELAWGAPSGPEAHVRVPQLPEGDGLCGGSPLQADDRSGRSQTVDGADARSLEENVPEKGSESTQRAQQGSPDADFQERLPTTSVRGEISLAPLEHPSVRSGEETGHSSGLGTSMSVVAEGDAGAPGSVPPRSDPLLEGAKESGPGCWEAGRKLKIITLEASVSETWPPRQLTGSKCNELEGGLVIPDGVWAASDVPKAGAARPEPASSEAASSCGPRTEPGSAFASSREIHGGEDKANNMHWSRVPSQCLSQPRLRESSVDPIDEMESRVTDLLAEASKTGRKDNVNVSRNQLRVERPAFLQKALARPKVLESSVDPIEGPGAMAWKARVQTPALSEPTLQVRRESKLNGGDLAQRVEAQPASSRVLCPQQSGENIPNGNRISRDQKDSERGAAGRSQCDEAKGDVQSTVLPAPGPVDGRESILSRCSRSPVEGVSERRSGEPEPRRNNKAESVFPILPLSSHLAVMTPASVGINTHHSTGQGHDVPENDLGEPGNQNACLGSERGAVKSEYGNRSPPSSGLTQGPLTSSEGSITDFSRSHDIEEREIGGPPIGESKPTSTLGSRAVTPALISRRGTLEKVPTVLQGPCHQGSILGHGQKLGEEKAGHVVVQAGSLPAAPQAGTGSEKVREKQATPGSGHLAEGVKKKILSRVAALRLRLEERENVRKNSILLRKSPKLETSVSSTDEKKDPQRPPPCQLEGRAPVLLKKIQAEIFPDHPGNIKLSCQFAEIHEDSTLVWIKDSRLIAQAQRRAGDDSAVSLAIVQASQKDQGLYYCCLNNSYGKVTAEFNLTAEVLKQLSNRPDIKGYEEIEFSQLIFQEDFLNGSYFGGRLRGQIATEQLHFGEGVHRKAFRSKVMQGLMPVFEPGHACVLKVHNAVAYGTRNNDELIQRNYKLAAQECYVQNTARYYAKIYAAEAQPLEGFGEVPEIIPIFLIHRPENNIPYATVEEELIGEFVKYSIRDGKEINFLRRESEAGQKCCTFQHWVYQKTSGCLLVTDMQGVGMKLTDVGIATLAKGYKGFKGNCSMTFIDQFKALHQCNKYCKMLGLKSLQNNNQKPKKASIGKSKIQPNSSTVTKPASGAPAEKRT
uniref:Alpha-protein kinase 2 n=1 Tax=Catagonus wagneri TaxID=51154 RepID=A0A8C3WB14_9CETA